MIEVGRTKSFKMVFVINITGKISSPTFQKARVAAEVYNELNFQLEIGNSFSTFNSESSIYVLN